MNIAVIPARGGSKRIPRKNIKLFRGKPMIAWSIQVALQSGCFSQVIVSTDDPEIAATASAWGADVPFERPSELATDTAGTIPVVAHAIDWLKKSGHACDAVCCIYATAPFLTSDDVRQGLELLRNNDCDFVFPAVSYGYPVQRAFRLTAERRVEMLDPNAFAFRSQDLETIFHDAGQFYWGRPSAWQSGESIFSRRSIALQVPTYRVQDIDTPEDWIRAEIMAQALESTQPST